MIKAECQLIYTPLPVPLPRRVRVRSAEIQQTLPVNTMVALLALMEIPVHVNIPYPEDNKICYQDHYWE